MIKTFVQPEIAPLSELWSKERTDKAMQNLITLGGHDLLAKFCAVVDGVQSQDGKIVLPQDKGNYYCVFGDVFNGEPLIVEDALKFWLKELHYQPKRKQNSKHPKPITLGESLREKGRTDIVLTARCVIKKLASEIRSKKDRKTGQIVVYKPCDELYK